MKKLPFSIIIPTYNRESFIKIAVDSVLMQSFPDYELIVIDDGSTDRTKEIISREQTTSDSNKKVKYIYQEHLGVSSARNAGIKQAKGEFICFLDSDDRLRHDKLAITHDYIKKYPEYKIFHTEEIWYRSGQFLPQKKYHKKPTGWVFENSVKLCSIGMSTVAIKREVFQEIGIFDESLPACEDYDFLLRATSKLPVYLIPEYLTIKEGGRADQQSRKYPAMDTFRIYALTKILETGKLNKNDYKTAFFELKNKCEIYIKGALKRAKMDEASTYKKLIEKFSNGIT